VILEGRLEESHYESLLEPWEEAIAGLDAAADAARLKGAAEDEPSDEEVEEAEDEEAEDEEAEDEFGPNADSVTDFLNRLWLLTPEQVGRLVGGWQNVDRDDLKAAHEGLRAVADEDAEWRDQVRRAQQKLALWLNAGRIQETAGFLGQTGQGESRKMAGPALADAIAALVLGDLLERKHAETLYGPWFNLIGAPPLPVAEEKAPGSGKAAKGAGGKKPGPGAGKPGPAAKSAAAAAKPGAAAAKPGPAAAKPGPAGAKTSKPAGKSTNSGGKAAKK
jgi:hypothetical protein